MCKKLSSNKGSISVLTLFILALTILFIGLISNQILNQIKINKNTESYMENKYLAEAGIEQGIATYIKSIEINGIISDDINKFNGLNIIKQYLLQAKYINKNNGIIEDTIDNIISNIDQQINSNKVNLETIKGLIENLLNLESLNSNNAEKKLVKNEISIAHSYLLNMMDPNKTSISNIKYIIERVNSNIDSSKMDVDDSYKMSDSETSVDNYLGDLKNKLLDIGNKINSIEQNPSDISNIKSLEESIANLKKYIEITRRITQVKDPSILDKTSMTNKYGNRKDDNLMDILLNRVITINLELELINEYMQDMIDSMNKSIYSDNRLYLHINYNQTDNKAYKIETIYSDLIYDILSVKKESNTQYEILQKGAYIKIPIIVDSVSDKYKLQSKVEIVVKNILSEDNYTIDYEIISWKKK